MTETIPVYIKGKDDVVLLEPAPANQVLHSNMPDIAPPRRVRRVPRL